jgi:hypothetical protein
MKKMTKQRLWGIALILLSAALLWLASTGETVEDRDSTAVLFTLPLGVYALTTRHYILYDGTRKAKPEARAGPRAERIQAARNRHPPRSGQGARIKKGATAWHENAL